MVNQKNNGAQRGRPGFLPVLILVILLAVSYVCAITALTPKRYDVGIGTVAEETITATRTVEDTATTEALRDAARASTPVVYDLDEEQANALIGQAEGFFREVQAFRAQAQTIRSQTQSADFGTAWESVLSLTQMQELLSKFDVPLTTEQGFALLSWEEGELVRLQDAVLPKLSTSLLSGLEEAAIATRRTMYVQELNATSLSQQLKDVGSRLFEAYLQPTFLPDEAATEKAREEAAVEVAPVEIKQGDVIVKAGEAITEEQLAILRSLELVRTDGSDLQLDIGAGIYLLLIFAVFAVYLYQFQKPILAAGWKNIVILGVAMGLTMLLALLCNTLNSRITPGLYAVMIIAIMVDRRTAMAANVVLSLVIGLLSGGRGSAMLAFDATTMTVSMLVAGQIAIFALGSNSKRSAIIGAGAAAGAGAALTIVAAYIMLNKPVSAVLVDGAFALGSNIIATVLVVGTLAVWETLFDVATGARLNELSNANHPLLRQLMTEAPGTYHHSMMAAALAEGAAEAIGADPLLARVGAYYHDVGKLRRPLYFAENQKGGENIHDTLPPQDSASIIISHQKDSGLLLTKHKLPSAVIQISLEHHGNTMVAYFYHKAVKEAGTKPVSQKAFRYPASRPSTLESAIVMLADSCEAAVRSIQEPNREKVEEMVHKVVKGKIDDGQFNLCPLTFQQIAQIENSFLRTFTGLMHERIEYPGQKNGK